MYKLTYQATKLQKFSFAVEVNVKNCFEFFKKQFFVIFQKIRKIQNSFLI